MQIRQTPKSKSYNEFCSYVADAIIREAANHDMNPRIVFERIRAGFVNKMECIERANPDRRSDVMDALAYSALRMPCSSYAVYAQGEWGQAPSHNCPELDKIIYSGNRTIVFWKDGTKTVVKCAQDSEFDEYSGFVAALAKKVFGSTHRIKKLISRISTHQDKKPKDKADGNI